MEKYINALDGQHVQEFIQLCLFAEKDGIIDARLRTRLQGHMSAIILGHTKEAENYQNAPPQEEKQYDICPSCGRGLMIQGKQNPEAEFCSVKCGYSRLVKRLVK